MTKTYYSGQWYLTIVKNEGEEVYCYFDLIKDINHKMRCPVSQLGSIEKIIEVIKGHKEIDELPENECLRKYNTENFKMYEDFLKILNKELEDETNEQNKINNIVGANKIVVDYNNTESTAEALKSFLIKQLPRFKDHEDMHKYIKGEVPYYCSEGKDFWSEVYKEIALQNGVNYISQVQDFQSVISYIDFITDRDFIKVCNKELSTRKKKFIDFELFYQKYSA